VSSPASAASSSSADWISLIARLKPRASQAQNTPFASSRSISAA
jgi:hypothetical protein